MNVARRTIMIKMMDQLTYTGEFSLPYKNPFDCKSTLVCSEESIEGQTDDKLKHFRVF